MGPDFNGVGDKIFLVSQQLRKRSENDALSSLIIRLPKSINQTAPGPGIRKAVWSEKQTSEQWLRQT